ncbi:hypothetical protein COU57_01450 [Candidatus Pacearchaeota archaeon CG10_big_fil_rev_8_21_14_0_10_32_14]|nr:MAG: hypothetical protein COU57_01450 [Candidatus Pacearchaeota archaeon CG10_big_fil_rev_8_21_14_0_10_32_14]
MRNINEFYPEDVSYLRDIWDKQPFFDPSLFYIRKKDIINAINDGSSSTYFIDQVRTSFIPHKDNAVVQKVFTDAMNRGIIAINQLLKEHFNHEEYNFFKLQEVTLPFNFSKFMKEARDDFIAARSGKRPTTMDYESLLKSYDKVRAFGLGYRILMIDESPEIMNAKRHHKLILKWFDEQFDFKKPSKVHIEGLNYKWQSVAGVDVYGVQSPIRSRLKILGDDGRVSYGSILMKMFLKGQYPDKINDHIGVEFVVENEVERDKLVRFFRKEIRAMERLENYKVIKYGEASDNESSALGYDAIKFIIRPPIPTLNSISNQVESIRFERIPVEVQILILQSHIQRVNNPEVEHKSYKERQFKRFFPVLFPKDIYFPLLNKSSN